MRDFNKWIETFRNSINGYDYYVDFEKVYDNVESIKVELNIMNSLIGSKDIKKDFVELAKRYPEILKSVPILLAIRQKEVYAQDEEGAFFYNFERANYSIEQYLKFMEKTGLLDLMTNHIINNLVDYVMGIEVGLDSNGRKNRGGHQMENLVEKFIQDTGAEYYKEMYIEDVERKWNVDLSPVSENGTSTKRWDFVVKTDDKIFVIETNFYTATGSKLGETARSYEKIANSMTKVDGVEFMWITDGAGWPSTRKNLQETFNVMDYIYNIKDMEDGVLIETFRK